MIRSTIALLTALSMVVLFAGSANAEGDGTYVGGTPNQLRTRSYTVDPVTGHSSPSTCSSQVFRVTQDSPIDSNNHALLATICAGDYAVAFTDASKNGLGPLGGVLNLSFDYLTSSITGARQVRIEVTLSNGDGLHLDPASCSKPFSVTGGTYSRADFSGTAVAGACSVSDSHGATFTSNGTESALQVYADGHPGVTVSSTLIKFFDSTTSTHTYNVDRIALGTGYLYNYSKLRAVVCTTESSC